MDLETLGSQPIMSKNHSNLIDCNALQFHQCIQDKSSYQDGHSPIGVDPSLVLVLAWYKLHLEFTKRFVGPDYVDNLLIRVHMYPSDIWEGLVVKDKHRKNTCYDNISVRAQNVLFSP